MEHDEIAQAITDWMKSQGMDLSKTIPAAMFLAGTAIGHAAVSLEQMGDLISGAQSLLIEQAIVAWEFKMEQNGDGQQ